MGAAWLAEQVEAYLDEYAETWPFSGSVLVAKDGEVIFKKGYGYASVEHRIPNTPETKFRIWSVGKQFTAMAVMILHEKGLLNIDDPIAGYLPAFPKLNPHMTIRHLLTHTSGLFNYTNSYDFHTRLNKLRFSLEEVVVLFQDKPLAFEPGTAYAYCNSGYFLLGLVIEHVSGQRFWDFLTDTIIQPLGMNGTVVDDNKIVIPGMAYGYQMDGEDLVRSEYIDMSSSFAVGGQFFSTVEDLFLWDQSLYTEKLVSAEMLAQATTPFRENYGFAWWIDEKYARRRLRHDGAYRGYNADYHRYLDDRLCIIVLSNYGFAVLGGICDALAGIAFGHRPVIPVRPPEIPLAPAVYESYMGEYNGEDGTKINVSRDGDKLFFILQDTYSIPFYPISETRFHHTIIDREYEFKLDEEGQVHLLGTRRKER